MFWKKAKSEHSQEIAVNNRFVEDHLFVKHLKQSVAYIQFTPTGEIKDANQLFLKTVEYTLADIIGKHHRIFCEHDYAQSPEYKTFWAELAEGRPQKSRFQRKTKSGKLIWLEATYLPLQDSTGVTTSVVKLATDITASRNQELLFHGFMNAADRSMAIISFTPDGTIIEANENFLNTVNYTLDEIKGKHHRIFCLEELTKSHEYAEFWNRLRSGYTESGLMQRKNKQGKVIWLEAHYNPVYDMNGKLIKVIKFASDVSARTENTNNAVEAVNSTATETEQVYHHAKQVLESSIEKMDQITHDIDIVVDDIHDLNSESEKINSIVATISSIAEQTNLLALNAAIEAARAGEQGRGFAVVADEVRQLAARTTASTKEITAVVQNNAELASRLAKNIDTSKEKSQQGVELIVQVDGIFKEINQGMNNIVAAIEKLNN